MIKRILLLLLLPLSVYASGLPEQSNVPGGIVALTVSPVSTSRPMVEFQKEKVMVVENNGFWTALIGIPLSITPGKHQASIFSEGKPQSPLTFDIVDKEYPAQYLTIKNQRMVNPNPNDLRRIEKERVSIDRALNTWTAQERVDTDFIAPVDGRLSSLFGLKRYFNKQPKDPHSGLDIAAPAGTPIKAPAPAIVIATGNYYYNGNTVFLDHGQGLITGYFHMTKIKVKPGQRVYRGEMLGTVGETGRVTGPHLHWNVYLNKNKVDPALFIAQYMPILDARNKK